MQRVEETHANLFTNYKYEKILALIFICTLPLINPWVRGDGVGYYAYARALLIEHRLDFRQDWLRANSSFRMGRVDEQNQLLPAEYTSTGHVDNHFSIGPAILWSPFLLAAHGAVKIDHLFGGNIPADGFSFPYIFATVIATALYGFLGLFISFQIARKYLPARWAFLGSLGIWFASSLPVYMYFNPSWSHAHSAFADGAVRLVLGRHPGGSHLDAMASPRLDCRPDDGRLLHLNVILLLVPLFESLAGYWQESGPGKCGRSATSLLAECSLCVTHIFVAFVPTLIVKKIIYGSYSEFGYGEHWIFDFARASESMLFLRARPFSWTPILILLAVIGLFFCKIAIARWCCIPLLAFVTYLYIIGCYDDWAWNFFLRQPLFCLADAAIHSGLGCVLRLARATHGRNGARLSWLHDRHSL